jgi:hypothetical protein
MRIGILTLPLHTNYGGILQAYALQTVLERMGHEVKVLDKPFKLQKLPWWKRPYSYTKRAIKKYLLGEKVLIFQEQNTYQRQATERKFTQPFIDSHIHRFVISHLTDIKPTDFDAIVVGSDQIWRMMYFKGLWSTELASDAFLGFTKDWDIRRISYAASFGVDIPDIPQNEIEQCKIAIERFNGVSVREESGVAACKNLFGVNAKWVLDPTMLLTITDYQKLKERRSIVRPILMSYVLDETPEIANLRNKIAKKKCLEVKITNLPDTGTGERGKRPQPPLEDWLEAFDEAEYVITDSFHACVFSILFHRQFTVIANEKRGMARFKSLLGLFGLENRMITKSGEYHEISGIDYDEVDKILTRKREEAFAFITDSLNK